MEVAMRMKRALVGVLLAAQAGCTTVHVVQSPSTELAAVRPARVFVTKADGSMVTIVSPKVIDDTIFGFEPTGQQTTLAVRDAKTVEVKQLAVGKTIGLAGVGFAGAVAAAALVVGKGTSLGTNPNVDCDKHPDSPGCGATGRAGIGVNLMGLLGGRLQALLH